MPVLDRLPAMPAVTDIYVAILPVAGDIAPQIADRALRYIKEGAPSALNLGATLIKQFGKKEFVAPFIEEVAKYGMSLLQSQDEQSKDLYLRCKRQYLLVFARVLMVSSIVAEDFVYFLANGVYYCGPFFPSWIVPHLPQLILATLTFPNMYPEAQTECVCLLRDMIEVSPNRPDIAEAVMKHGDILVQGLLEGVRTIFIGATFSRVGVTLSKLHNVAGQHLIGWVQNAVGPGKLLQEFIT